jgi:hypothetical protein
MIELSSNRVYGLVEGYAYSLLFAPDDAAEHVMSVRWQDQGEMIGDSDGGGDVQRRASIRKISDHAVDGAAAELNRSGLKNAVPSDSAMLVHNGSE